MENPDAQGADPLPDLTSGLPLHDDPPRDEPSDSAPALPASAGIGWGLVALVVIGAFWWRFGTHTAFWNKMYRLTEVLLTIAAILCIFLIGERLAPPRPKRAAEPHAAPEHPPTPE